MEIGDHLVTPRTGYSHHGLYVGDGMVIHYSGLADGVSSGAIELTSFEAFHCGRAVRVRHYRQRKYSRDQSVSRAYSRLGEDGYNVVLNNCEHFVSWCITGRHSSEQVNRVATSVANTALTVQLLKQRLARRARNDTVQAGFRLFSARAEQTAARSLLQAAAPALGKGLVSASTPALAHTASLSVAVSSAGMSSSVASTSAGVVAGLTAASSTAAPVMTGLVSLAGGTALTAVAGPALIAVGVGYGVKKLFDLFGD